MGTISVAGAGLVGAFGEEKGTGRGFRVPKVVSLQKRRGERRGRAGEKGRVWTGWLRDVIGTPSDEGGACLLPGGLEGAMEGSEVGSHCE